MARYATTAAACGRQVPWIKLGTKQGCRQLEGTNKIKTKELQFGSRGRLHMPPPARSKEAKISLKSKRCKRTN